MRRRPGYFGALHRAAGVTAPGQDRTPQDFARMLAERRPPAVTSPIAPSPVAPAAPAPQSAALATTVAAQQDAAAPTNGSAGAPSIPPAVRPAPPMPAPVPPRAYPAPAAAGEAPVSGFWGGGQSPQVVMVTQPGAAAAPQAPAAAASSAPSTPAAPSAFQQAIERYSDDDLNRGVMVDTSTWTPADFQAAVGDANFNPAVIGPPGSAQANAWASTRVSQQRHPADPAAQARAAAENNALRAAQTAAMGQLVSGPQFTTPVSNPAEVAARFAQSGYTGAQALADGWGTGTGRAGWESLPGWSNPLNSAGLMGAPYVNQAPANSQTPAATPQSPGADSYAPPGYTPGVAAPPASGPLTPLPTAGPRPTVWSPPQTGAPPQSPPSGTVVDTQRPQASAPPPRPDPMKPLGSYFHQLGKAAGGGF